MTGIQVDWYTDAYWCDWYTGGLVYLTLRYTGGLVYWCSCETLFTLLLIDFVHILLLSIPSFIACLSLTFLFIKASSFSNLFIA